MRTKLLLIVIFALFGCKDVKQDLDALFNEEKSRTIVVLVDFSKSIPGSTIDWYNNVIKEDILTSLQVNDKLFVLPVDKAAQTSGIEIASIILNKDKFSSLQDPPNQKQELIKRRISKFLDTESVNFSNQFYSVKEQRSKYSSKTDIIGAFQQAIKYFNKETKNSIVILSDMKQDTEELNLENYLSSRPDPLKLVQKTSGVDLRNANVFVLTGDQPNIGIKDFNWLKEFWVGYVDKNKGNLIIYESGGVSLLKENL